MVENLPANVGDIKDVDSIPGWKNPLEEGMATHSSILAWRFSWTEEPGGPPEDIKKRWQEYTEELYKKDLHDPDNHDGVITHSPRARHPGM